MPKEGQIPKPISQPYVPKSVRKGGDVRSKADVVRALEGIDAVFHLAAYQDYLPDFSTFFHVNSVGTALLYEVIVERKLPVQKVVVASSQAVYGEGKYICRACKDRVRYPDIRSPEQLEQGEWEICCPVCGAQMEPEWTDESVVHPQNQYAISKYIQELIALNLGKRYGIPTVCMRYSIVQGPPPVAAQCVLRGVSNLLSESVLRPGAGGVRGWEAGAGFCEH